MWYVPVQERCIIIQNGRLNEIEVNMHDVTAPIATSYKENKSCHGSKKGGVAKIFSGKSAIKLILKNLPYAQHR